MPKTKRDYLKGTVATAYLSLTKTILYLSDIATAFHSQHPEIERKFEGIIDALSECQILIEDVYSDIWGNLPLDWRATARRR